MDYTPKDVLRAVSEAGYTVTERQLERWRAAGLLPKGRRHGRGRGSFWTFPAETVPRAILIAKLRATWLPLYDIGIRLWLERYTISLTAVRSWLRRSAEIRRFRRLKRTTPREAAERFTTDLATRANAELRRKYGIPTHDIGGVIEAYETIGTTVESFVGAVQSGTYNLNTDSTSLLLKMMFGLPTVESDRMASLGINLETELKATMPAVAAFDRGIDDATDAALEAAREFALTMSSTIQALRTLPDTATSEFAKILVRSEEATSFLSTGGLLWALAAIRRTKSEIPSDDVAARVESAKATLKAGARNLLAAARR